MNHKIVWLSVVVQYLACIAWAHFTPFSSDRVRIELMMHSLLPIAISIIIYVYFYAFLLNKMQVSSKLKIFITVILIWLFYMLPQLFIIKEVLALEKEDVQFILILSGGSVFINSIILPFSRSSRSIFKH